MSQKKKYDIGVMKSELADDMTLSEKQSLAAARTNEIKKKKMKDEVHLFIKYRRRNGLKVGMREASRVLQCSINSVRKYWLTEFDYPIEDGPEEGWKYNRHGVIEPITDIGSLDDDSDFFTVRERRLPDFLDDTNEVRKPIKKKKKPKSEPTAFEKALEMQAATPNAPTYFPLSLLEELETVSTITIEIQERKKLDAWLYSDDDSVKNYLREESHPFTKKELKAFLKGRPISMKRKEDADNKFFVKYYMNQRLEDGKWEYCRLEYDRLLNCVEKRMEFTRKSIPYQKIDLVFDIQPNGELKLNKMLTDGDYTKAFFGPEMEYYQPLSEEEAYKASWRDKETTSEEKQEILFKTGWRKYLLDTLDMDFIYELYEKAGHKKPQQKKK